MNFKNWKNDVMIALAYANVDSTKEFQDVK